QLIQKGCTSIADVFKDKEAALVIVSGMIPAGASVGDAFDVEVTLPAGSQATSLRGGVLEECLLSSFATARSKRDGSVETLPGHPLARAGGILQPNVGDDDGGDRTKRLTQAHIWQGGRTRVDNPYGLVLNTDHQFNQVSHRLALRINESIP